MEPETSNIEHWDPPVNQELCGFCGKGVNGKEDRLAVGLEVVWASGREVKGSVHGGLRRSLPRVSKYPRFTDSGPTNTFRVWSVEPETSNIGYLDPLC